MALYALGDLHLGFQVKKPMDAFGTVWKHHEKKIEKYVNRIVGTQDTLVLTGDHSWGKKLPSVKRICGLSRIFRDEKFSFAAITTCFGMRRKPNN